jgi:hypothetical protein
MVLEAAIFLDTEKRAFLKSHKAAAVLVAPRSLMLTRVAVRDLGRSLC